MAKGRNQKLKLLYLAKLFYRRTDEEHGLSAQDIIDLLGEYEVSAERKTIYQDIEELRQFGMDIVPRQTGRHIRYHLLSRDFELPELKLLVDSVQSAKFMTENKSRALIKKLETLASVHEARKLHRQVVLSGRVKTMNESIYYTVDTIHAAISENVVILFQYAQWSVEGTLELRREGAWYEVSPWALLCQNENYYLLAYDHENQELRHYRVDKMVNLSLTKKKREGEELFHAIDLPEYAKGMFNMFSGEPVMVTLLCENWMAGPIIDRFGKDCVRVRVDEGHFQVCVQVAASLKFLSWVVSMGSGVRLTAPESMVEAMREQVRRLTEVYL